jgi:PadR family transcriptional regulator, regulator of vanillate utilization
LSLRHILLGLLSENSGHGYGLRKQFLNRLSHFRSINEGQLYTELARMEKEGWIEREVVVPEKGPAKKLLHITPKGRQVFQDWLRSEQYEDEGLLYDFIHGYPFFTKCSFFKHLEPDQARKKIRAQLSRTEKKKKAYQEILLRMERRRADPFRVRILTFGLREMEIRTDWLKALECDLGPEQEPEPSGDG